MNLNYNFTKNSRILTYILMAIGILALIYGFITDHETHSTRVWSNILVNSFFFLGIALASTFFIAVQYAAEAAWATALKRVFEAIGTFLPFAAIAIIIVFAAGSMHWHHIYHWMAEGITLEGHENYDEIIAGKAAYLNQPFFWIRTLVYLGVWIYFTRLFRKRSLEEDLVDGTKLHFKNISASAFFLVFFAVTSSTSAWDWIMSIDSHWFSTLFGWYTFSGMWISGIIVMILLTLHLKSRGHLEAVNENHLHDLGKWMFAISFLWSYLWFSQFMLIWYANIPEEVSYYISRIDNYRGIFFATFLINFALPMLFLMARDSKRNRKYLVAIGLIIFIGHWMDVFVMVMPGSVGEHWGIGFLEIGMFLGFLGLFLNVVLRALTKAPLMVQKHPFLEESIHHHV